MNATQFVAYANTTNFEGIEASVEATIAMYGVIALFVIIGICGFVALWKLNH